MGFRMSMESNPFSVSPASQVAPVAPSFGAGLSLWLAVPVVMAIGAWVAQWLLRFPPHSPGASLTAVTVVAALVAVIVPVPIALTKLIRNPALRTRRNIILTSFAGLLLLLGVVVLLAVVAGS